MRARNDGQALVEFVLLFPLVLVIILFVIEFGFALHTHITINGAAREAARFAAVANLPSASPGTCDSDSIEERAVASSTSIADCDEVAVGYIEQNGAPEFSRGDGVVVRISHTYEAKTPLVALMSVVSFGTVPSSFQVFACADARLEGQPSDQTPLIDITSTDGDCG